MRNRCQPCPANSLTHPMWHNRGGDAKLRQTAFRQQRHFSGQATATTTCIAHHELDLPLLGEGANALDKVHTEHGDKHFNPWRRCTFSSNGSGSDGTLVWSMGLFDKEPRFDVAPTSAHPIGRPLGWAIADSRTLVRIAVADHGLADRRDDMQRILVVDRTHGIVVHLPNHKTHYHAPKQPVHSAKAQTRCTAIGPSRRLYCRPSRQPSHCGMPIVLPRPMAPTANLRKLHAHEAATALQHSSGLTQCIGWRRHIAQTEDDGKRAWADGRYRI